MTGMPSLLRTDVSLEFRMLSDASRASLPMDLISEPAIATFTLRSTGIS